MISSGKTGRTKSVLNRFGATDKALYRAARADFANVESMMDGSGKFNDAMSEIEREKPAFGNGNWLTRG